MAPRLAMNVVRHSLVGMYAGPKMPAFRVFRIGGMTLTIALLIVCAVMILFRLAR